MVRKNPASAGFFAFGLYAVLAQFSVVLIRGRAEIRQIQFFQSVILSELLMSLRFQPSLLALSISLMSGSALAADYTISTASTSQNGGNTIDGADSLTVISGGSISSSGTAIVSTSNSNTITIDEGAFVMSASGRGISVGQGSDNAVTVSGSVTGGGTGGQAFGVLLDTNNVGVGRNSFTLTSSGSVTASASEAVGFYTYGGDVTVTIAGTITATNAGYGLYTYGSDNGNFTISGTITAGDTALWNNLGDDNTFVISGSLIANSSGGYAIYNQGTGNIYTLGEGVRIIGDIFLRDADGTAGNILKFDVGSSMSYVYDTTGSWTLEDLDGRSVVSGSAMAAGIGNAETADELQYLRLSQINNSLLNRADRYALVAGERQAWADPFYFQSERDASSSDATIEDYDADGYGLTVGLPIVLKGLDADVILGVQETELDIHSGTQTIDVTSLRAGLYFPNLLTKDAIRVSGKALIGYNQHDMDRQVLVNTNTTTGITTYTADYDSWEAVAGLEAEHSQAIGSGATTLTASLGADLVYEAIESYDEIANFHWDSRDLLQGVTKASIGLHHVHTNGMKTYAIASVQARDVLDGKTTDYAINGTAVNFRGGDYNDTIAQLNLGATYQAKDNLQLGLNLQAATSDNDVDSYAASARMNWKF